MHPQRRFLLNAQPIERLTGDPGDDLKVLVACGASAG